MLFAARLLQGAADGMTWIVGFAMIADLYGDDERGRAMGLAMAGSTLGIIIGPVLGGWLYEIGGIRLPFLVVAALAVIDLVVFAHRRSRTRGSGASAPMRAVLTHRPVAITRAGGHRRRRHDRDARAGHSARHAVARWGSGQAQSARCSASPPSRRRRCTRFTGGSAIAGADDG